MLTQLQSTILFLMVFGSSSQTMFYIWAIWSLSISMIKKIYIVRVTKDVNPKANSIMCTFGFTDPFVLTYLFKMYCLSLYGCTLWSLCSSALKYLQVAINKILRRIWHLPPNSHTSIVLNTTEINFLFCIALISLSHSV